MDGDTSKSDQNLEFFDPDLGFFDHKHKKKNK